MIAPIIRIELNSIQAIEMSQSSRSFAIVWVAFPYDRPSRLNIFFETTGTIRMIRAIIWKLGLTRSFVLLSSPWFSRKRETACSLLKTLLLSVEVSRRLAPWTIPPRQLSPDLRTTSPSFFYQLPSQTSR